jgi:hypothetical protein
MTIGCAAQKAAPASGPVPSRQGAGVAAAPTTAAAPEGGSPPLEATTAPHEDRRTSDKTTSKADPAWSACHRKVRPKGIDAARDALALASACEAVTKMKLVGKPLVGKQAEAEPPQSYPLKAEAKHCYRVYAQGQGGIEDLDVAIKDSAGWIAGQGAAGSATAVVPDDGAVCFKDNDAASVVVSVGRGGGTYAVQVWGN